MPSRPERLPLFVATSWPSVIVRPLMLTLGPAAISKMRLASLPLTDSLPRPGPLIVTPALISNSPLVSVMVPCSPGAKLMVSPLLASATANRNDLAPLSCRLDTVKVLSKRLSSSPSKRGRTERLERVGLDLRRRDRVAEPVVNDRTQDVNNMMQAFLERTDPQKKTSAPRLAVPPPGLAVSISFKVDC